MKSIRFGSNIFLTAPAFSKLISRYRCSSRVLQSGNMTCLNSFKQCINSSSANVTWRRSRAQKLRVVSLFEKFTERSIKSVMIAQQQAKVAGSTEVGFYGGSQS
jgi:hypothetical protein